MGPEPGPRSGHGIAALGSRIFVFGGETYSSKAAEDEENVYHVLNTSES